MATQMESQANPLQCPTCKGYGVVRGCEHQGHCPCGGVSCPDCNDESGIVTCDQCGETATRLDWLTRQPVCADCERPEEPADGAWPAMGQSEQEMREAQREARRLK